MFVYKCDICKKEIKDQDPKVSVSTRGILSSTTFCQVCGKPVLQFLKKKGLLEK